jgi:hypothetical protein
MTVLSRPMFNRGGMVHDERTIRNVDDEIYRIAPKTHGGGRERMDAREEYGRLLREKDYLRGQMNRMANGGGVAAMMDPAMMGGPPMPMAPEGAIPAPVANELAAMEQQGMALGADIAMQQEAAIDSAEDPKQLIDAMRGNQLPLQERYNELATFVGPNDAAITPTSVLALTQPAIIMASEGAVDQGIGNLMEGMTGDIMMDDAMGAAPMGMGVGELMAGSPPPPVPMNTGGAVPKLRFGSSSSETAPFSLSTEIGTTRDELMKVLGQATEQELDQRDRAIWASIADRAFAFGADRDPRTGEALEGNIVGKAGQAAQGLVGDIVKANAPFVNRGSQALSIAAQDALSRRTMQEKAGYDLSQALANLQARGITSSQLNAVLADPEYAQGYYDGTLSPQKQMIYELALANQQRDRMGIGEDGQFEMIRGQLPFTVDRAVEASPFRAGKNRSLPSDTGASDPTPAEGFDNISDELQSMMGMGDEDFMFEGINVAPALFSGASGTLKEFVDYSARVLGIDREPTKERDAARNFLRAMQTDIVNLYLSSPALRDNNMTRESYNKLFPDIGALDADPNDAQNKYTNVFTQLIDMVNTERNNQAANLYSRGDLAQSNTVVDKAMSEIRRLDKALSALNMRTSQNPARQAFDLEAFYNQGGIPNAQQFKGGNSGNSR